MIVLKLMEENEEFVIPWESKTFGHLEQLVKDAQILKEIQTKSDISIGNDKLRKECMSK